MLLHQALMRMVQGHLLLLEFTALISELVSELVQHVFNPWAPASGSSPGFSKSWEPKISVIFQLRYQTILISWAIFGSLQKIGRKKLNNWKINQWQSQVPNPACHPIPNPFFSAPKGRSLEKSSESNSGVFVPWCSARKAATFRVALGRGQPSQWAIENGEMNHPWGKKPWSDGNLPKNLGQNPSKSHKMMMKPGDLGDFPLNLQTHPHTECRRLILCVLQKGQALAIEHPPKNMHGPIEEHTAFKKRKTFLRANGRSRQGATLSEDSPPPPADVPSNYGMPSWWPELIQCNPDASPCTWSFPWSSPWLRSSAAISHLLTKEPSTRVALKTSHRKAKIDKMVYPSNMIFPQK